MVQIVHIDLSAILPFLFNFMPMNVHIGSIIKELVKTKGITVDEFSSKINCTRRNAYKKFDKPSIDTNLLKDIGKALGENLFFKYISDKEIAEYKNDKVKSSEVLEAIKDLKNTVVSMNEEKYKKTITKEKSSSSKTTKRIRK
jgi:hypothetical protein